MVFRLISLMGSAVALLHAVGATASPALYQVGVARQDITPEFPIRLSGYAARSTESEGVAQRIYAKALAIGADRDQPAVLITFDNCGVPAAIRAEVVARLSRRAGLASDRVAICATHTHTGPCLSGYLVNLFGKPFTPEEQAHLDRYTAQLTDALETVALAALKDRKAATLKFGIGHAGFARNRRNAAGPADQDLPVLAVMQPAGGIRAVLTSYACHCTTLGGEFNQICGDWAGFAQAALERDHPGAVALVAIGCGGDANPHPRPGLDLARGHGEEIGSAVARVLTNQMASVSGLLACRTRELELPFESVPSRAEWEERAKKEDHYGYQAKLNLAKLDRGEKIPDRLPYLVQAWTFGESLAMIFLPGEVVCDYSLRLKRELDPSRLWVNAYANDVACYIPSERVLKEGGYEGGGAMVYYDKPSKFAAGLEDKIIGAAHELVPKSFQGKKTAAADADPERRPAPAKP